MPNKCILLINQYNSDNIGDKLLGKVLAKKLSSFGYKVETCGYAQTEKQAIRYSRKSHCGIRNILKKKTPNYIKYLFKYRPKLKKESAKVDKKDCASLIIGGGQLVKHNTVFIYCLQFWLKWARKNKIPAHIFGVGVDNNLSKRERAIYRKLMTIPQSINCRDINSKRILRNELKCPNVSMSPDIAFISEPPKHIAKSTVTVMPYNYDKAVKAFGFDHARDEYYDYILNILTNEKAEDVTLSATTTDDAEECYKINDFLVKNGIKTHIEKIYEPEQLLELATRSSLLITGRMHAMIACKVCGSKIAPLIVSNKIDQFCKEYLNEKDLRIIINRVNAGVEKLMSNIRGES